MKVPSWGSRYYKRLPQDGTFMFLVFVLFVFMKFCLEMDHQREVKFKLYFKVHFFSSNVTLVEAFNMVPAPHIRSTVSPSIVM